jgi:hypothetical protein
MGRGAIKTVAAQIDKAPSYVSRMLYEPSKAGAKRIGEDTLELLAHAYPDTFDAPAAPAAASGEITDQRDVAPDMSEIRLLLGLTAKALAASIPGAGRELVDELERVAAPLRKGTFARDFADAVRSELPEHVRRRTAPQSRARARP